MASQHQSQVLNKNLCPLCHTVQLLQTQGDLQGQVWSGAISTESSYIGHTGAIGDWVKSVLVV